MIPKILVKKTNGASSLDRCEERDTYFMLTWQQGWKTKPSMSPTQQI